MIQKRQQSEIFLFYCSIIAAFVRLFVGGLFYWRILVFQVFPNFFDNLN